MSRVHTCSAGCNEPGCSRKFREEIARLNAEVKRLTAENAAVKLGHAQWKQMAIERGDEAVKDALLICRLEAQIKSLKKEGKKSK